MNNDVRILNDNLTDNSLIACSNKGLKKFNTNVNLTFQKRVKSKCYNPKSEKVGTVWKTQIKKESSDF